jgi:hypothetical protein
MLCWPKSVLKAITPMLAPLILDLFFASLLMLLAGWAGDALRASTQRPKLR